jgi:uncharacterized protein
MPPPAVASTAETVRIHYRRPPDREDLFVQRLVHREASCVVTLLENTPLDSPVVIDGVRVLEDGSPAVWFTFPGRWHDIGLFHLANGTPTGLYANILTPVRFHDPLTWETLDLFLDVWLDLDGRVRILDETEFEIAVANSVIDPVTAERARREAGALAAGAAAGTWPPPIVREWTLERVREAGIGR